jgi:preprotein translocase SecF subunit
VTPQTAFAGTDQIEKYLSSFKLASLQIVLGSNSNPTFNNVWIKLNTQIDSTVDQAIKDALNKKYSDTTLNYTPTNIGTSSNGYVIYVVSGFKKAPSVTDIKNALASLPNTGASTTTPTPAATTTITTATATKTAATATATQTTITPTATATSGATVQAPKTTTTNGTPVKVADIKIGATNHTAEITTYTQIAAADTGTKGVVTFPAIQKAVLEQGGPYMAIDSSTQVGGAVASQTIQNAFLSVLVASIFILLYIWFSFRKVPKALRYAVAAIIALLHDVLVVLGVFSILGKFLGIQIDALFITALLTVVGFSVHDTIVVFDRIRENMQRRTVESFDEVVNASLVQTMARSLNTSLTVLFTLLTLTLFTTDNVSVHNFTLALLVGIFSGTYSSIFNASMILVIWNNGELGFNRVGGGRQDRFSTRRDREAHTRELATTRS